VEIKPFSCILQSVIKNFSTIGPFSHLRPNSVLAEKTKVGNFSEVKKSIIGRGSKVPHLSYIGDSEIGEGVNIGAGTITCNYDGKEKHKTIIEDGAFIGSNTNLVAPVRVGKRALIGAGSTITENIPDDKLAIARAKQVIKEKRIK
jgi:bifunctional UDP-N-acetylglucosamine pyrophosphorylase/glucosamine-1-phosphate N-acetyltransferase